MKIIVNLNKKKIDTIDNAEAEISRGQITCGCGII